MQTARDARAQRYFPTGPGEVAGFVDKCLVELASNPWSSAERLLAVCCEALDAKAGRLLTLSPETGKFELLAEQAADRQAHDQLPPFASIAAHSYAADAHDTELNGCVLKRLTAVDNGLVVASIEVLLTAGQTVPPVLSAAFAKLLPLVRANAVLRHGLRVVPPIPDISGDEASFGARVFDYLDAHTHAALVAVFVVDDDLDVSLVYGPPGDEDRAFLTSDAVTRLVAEARLEPGSVIHIGTAGLSRMPHRQGVQSVAVLSTVDRGHDSDPDTSSEDGYVLLVGFPLDYSPSVAETAVFEHSLALAGYLHKVYSHLHKLVANIGEIAEVGSAITGLETSQMVRHHAKTQIDLAQNLIGEVQRNPQQSKEKLDVLATAINSVANDLEKIKEATRAPSRDPKPTSLKEMWDSACSQVRWRLARRRIEIRYDGRDVRVMAAPDWFRQVFLNLLLNSADAYDSVERRSGKITLHVHPFGASTDRVTMTYSDDATGVQPHHFLSNAVAEDVELSERIFRPGVTSKDGGSGWGLYVCRNIVARDTRRVHHLPRRQVRRDVRHHDVDRLNGARDWCDEEGR